MPPRYTPCAGQGAPPRLGWRDRTADKMTQREPTPPSSGIWLGGVLRDCARLVARSPRLHPRGVPTIGGRAFPGVGRPSTTPLPGLGPPNAAEPPRPGNSVGLVGCRLGWVAAGPAWLGWRCSPPPRVVCPPVKRCVGYPGPGYACAPAAGGGIQYPSGHTGRGWSSLPARLRRGRAPRFVIIGALPGFWVDFYPFLG